MILPFYSLNFTAEMSIEISAFEFFIQVDEVINLGSSQVALSTPRNSYPTLTLASTPAEQQYGFWLCYVRLQRQTDNGCIVTNGFAR